MFWLRFDELLLDHLNLRYAWLHKLNVNLTTLDFLAEFPPIDIEIYNLYWMEEAS